MREKALAWLAHIEKYLASGDGDWEITDEDRAIIEYLSLTCQGGKEANMTKGDETESIDSSVWNVWNDPMPGDKEVGMTEARKYMALRAIALIMEHYLPSLGGGRGGKEPHTLDTWGEIRKIVADSKED